MLQTQQSHFHLRTFHLAVPSAWNVLFSELIMGGSLSTCRAQFTCHLLGEAFSEHSPSRIVIASTSWVFSMCQAPFYVLFMYSLFESSQQPYKLGIIIISILQVRKLRLREFRDMTIVSQLTGRRAGIQIQQPISRAYTLNHCTLSPGAE